MKIDTKEATIEAMVTLAAAHSGQYTICEEPEPAIEAQRMYNMAALLDYGGLIGAVNARYMAEFNEHLDNLPRSDSEVSLSRMLPEYLQHESAFIDYRWIAFERPLERYSTMVNQADARAILSECIPDPLYWLWRENFRFFTSTYVRPEFINSLRRFEVSDIRNRIVSLWYHFPHISVEEPSMVAYTPSLEYGQRDRQVRVKVGRYLQQFYGDLLDATTIRSLANGVKQLDMVETETGQGIADVYARGPSSCMSGDASRFGQEPEFHPTIVYEGEFKMVYLVDPILPADRQILARALVHMPSNTFVRAYGCETETLLDRMTAAGYARYSCWPENARLKAIKVTCDSYLLPYLDGSSQYVSLTRCGKFWQIDSDGSVCANSQSGVWSETETQYCGSCEEDVEYDDGEGWVSSSYHGIDICPGCESSYRWAFSHRGRRDYIHEDVCTWVDSQDEYYHDECLSDYDIIWSEYSGDHHHVDELISDDAGDYMPQHAALKLSSGRHAYVPDISAFHQNQVTIVWHPGEGEYRVFLARDESDEMSEFIEDAVVPCVTDDFGTLVMPNVYDARALATRFHTLAALNQFLAAATEIADGTPMRVGEYELERFKRFTLNQGA